MNYVQIQKIILLQRQKYDTFKSALWRISISHIGHWFIIFLFWNTYHLLDKVMSWLHEIFSSWAYAYVHDSTCMRWTNGLYAVIYASASQPTLVLDLSSRHSDNLSFFIKWYVIKLIIPNIVNKITFDRHFMNMHLNEVMLHFIFRFCIQ